MQELSSSSLRLHLNSYCLFGLPWWRYVCSYGTSIDQPTLLSYFLLDRLLVWYGFCEVWIWISIYIFFTVSEFVVALQVSNTWKWLFDKWLLGSFYILHVNQRLSFSFLKVEGYNVKVVLLKIMKVAVVYKSIISLKLKVIIIKIGQISFYFFSFCKKIMFILKNTLKITMMMTMIRFRKSWYMFVLFTTFLIFLGQLIMDLLKHKRCMSGCLQKSGKS